MLASLLRPRKARWHSFHPAMSASGLPAAQETTPFLQSILRDDNSLAPTEPFDWNEQLEDEDVDNEQYELIFDDDSVHGPLLPIFSSPHLDLIPVYTTTHSIRLLIEDRCETTLTWDQLRSPQISQFLLKPIQQQIRECHFDRSTLYALMANCLQFNKEAETNPGNSGTCRTRALVAELLAIKLLREYTTRELIDGLSYDFYPLQGQDPRPFPTALRTSTWNGPSKNKQATGHARISCLEIAIRAQAKRFIAHPLVVQHLEAIWAGTIVFHSAADNLHRPRRAAPAPATRSHSFYGSTNPAGAQQHNKRPSSALPQEYPRRAATLYDPRDASLFKLSRLRVPRYRQFLSTISFAVLLGLYLAVLAERSVNITTVEVIFWLWSAGFILDEIVGFNEQGFGLYLMSFWNLFDLGILLLLFCYAILRLYGMAIMPDPDHLKVTRQAYDILSASAILLFPRLFSVLDHYKYFSQLLIAFRIMAADLMAVFLLIVVACSGFLVAFSFSPDSSQSPPEIVFALFQIVMGFTPTAWSIWEESNIIGRVILTLFLFICHFVVVTILITVLTNSFMAIVKNANEEHQFVFAINTISMVKSDALFSYIAPSNIIGWVVSPLRYCVSFRDFVKLNRTLIKITHFPILWSICFYEKMILCPRIIDPADLIQGDPRAAGRSTTVLRARNKRLNHFDSFNRLTREPSIATHQQDRVLEELFRTPLRQEPVQGTSEGRTRSRKSTMVNHWMQGMDSEDHTKFHPALRRMGSTLRRNYTETTRSAASDPEEFISYSNLRPVPEHSILYGSATHMARHASHATDVDGDDEKSSDENNDDESDLGQTSMHGSKTESKKPEQTPCSSEKNSNKTPPKFFSSRPSTAVYNSRKNSPPRLRHHERNPSGVTVLHRAPGDADHSSDDSLPGPSSPLKRTEARRPGLPPRKEFMSVPNIHRIGSDMGEAGVLPSSLATQLAPDNDILGRLVLARMNNIEEGFREVLKEVKDMRGRSSRESKLVSRNDINDEIYP